MERLYDKLNDINYFGDILNKRSKSLNLTRNFTALIPSPKISVISKDCYQSRKTMHAIRPQQLN